MNLFEQMIDYIRAQQMYAYLNCVLNNKFDKFTFLTEDYIVTDGFIGKERKPKEMNDEFKKDMFKTFIIHKKPNATPEMNQYYTCIKDMNNKFQTGNKTVINYDKFVETMNEQK